MFAHALLLAALAAASPSPSPSPSPVQIYVSALSHLKTLPQPAYIDTVQNWKVLAQTPTSSPTAAARRII